MPRLNSFFLPPESWPADGSPAVLDGEEAAHMLKVLRHRAGDRVRLFDGRGREGEFRIERASRREAELARLSEVRHPRPRGGLTLAVGWNRALRRGVLLEKAVELGARAVVFFPCERSQGAPPDEPKESWNAKLAAAAKQCGSPWLPEVKVLGDFAALHDIAAEFTHRYVLWEDASGGRPLASDDLTAPGESIAVVGPEGGFEVDEVQRLTQWSYAPVTLGDSVLRWETAAILCLGLFFWARGLAASAKDGQ